MAFNKTSLAQAMMGNGGFMARAPGGKGKGHKYDLTGTDSGAGFQEPTDATDPEETGEQDNGADDSEFQELKITPSDNGGFVIDCQYKDDGSGNVEPDSTHTFEDLQSALDFVTQKMSGEPQPSTDDQTPGGEMDDANSADGGDEGLG